MKNRVSDATLLLVAWLLSGTFSAQALTLAELRGSVVIGRPLDVTVQVQPAAAEEVSGNCVTAEVLYADARQANARVSVTPATATAMGAAAVLRVQVAADVNEPVVTVVVRATCGSSTQRRYVLLADFPTTMNLAQPTVPTVPTVDTALVTMLPLPAMAPAAAVAVPGGSSGAAAKPARVLHRSSLKPARSTSASALPQQRKSAARVAGKAVLKLDPLDIFSDRMDTLDAMVFAPTEDALLHSRKITELEQDVKTLRALAASNDAKLSTLRLQLQQAQASQVPVWVLPGIGLLLLLCMLALGWLLWQQRRLAQAQDLSEWWQSRDLVTPVASAVLDVGPVQTPPPDAQAVQAVKPVPEPVVPESVPVAAVPALHKVFPSTPKPARAAPMHRTIDIDLDDVLLPQPLQGTADLKTAPALQEGHSIRHISVEPILDIRQQAEFFVSLGQSDRAMSILKQQISTSTQPNPLVYLDLISLYHTLGMKTEYHESAALFNQLFNGIIPDFVAFNAQTGGLEDYPETLNQLASLWPRAEALAFLDACIFNDPLVQQRQRFELTAFRDLLLLDAMVDDLTRPA